MKYQYILIVAFITTITFCAFENHQTKPVLNKVLSNLSLIDSFSLQNEISIYCNILSKEKKDIKNLFLCRKQIKKLRNQILQLKDSIAYCVKIRDSLFIESFTSTFTRSDTFNKIDSLNIFKIHYLDSIISLFQNVIKYRNADYESRQLIKDSLTNDSINNQVEIKNQISKIRKLSLSVDRGQRVNICSVNYVLYFVDLKEKNINIHLFDERNNNYFTLQAVEEDLKKRHITAEMVTNAGMYTPSFEPEGLYIQSDKRIKYPIDTLTNISNANFYLEPNGVFYIDSFNHAHIVTTKSYRENITKVEPTIKVATQSGPMLVINGELHSKFMKGSNNLKIRSGVGLQTQDRVVFAITLDETNFYDFASVFKNLLGCNNALFLDGAISEVSIAPLDIKGGDHKFGPIFSVTKKTK